MLRLLLPSAILFCAGPVHAQERPVFRVDAGAHSTAAAGTSWDGAFSELQDGIDAAFHAGGGEVWVKAGVYKPTGTGRDASFELRPGVRLYGGFRGTEEHRTERNVKANRTVLNGDIGGIGDDEDNCYHVVIGATDSRIDGFIIARGHANGLKQKGAGGAVFIPEGTTKMHITQCTFEKNQAAWQGGAIYGERVDLVITNSSFFSNSAANGGGVAVRGASSIAIRQSSFSANLATAAGGAVNLENMQDASFADCRFQYNGSKEVGGALAVSVEKDADAELEIKASVFSENRAEKTGGGIYAKGPFTPQLTGCVIVRNTGGKGTGGVVLDGGVLAVMQACTVANNRGIGELDLFADDSSKVFESMDLLLASVAPVEEEPEPEPPKVVDDVFVYSPRNRKVKLRSIIAEKPFTVITKGDLTDTVFIDNYRIIDALAVDYEVLEVQFFYLYGPLAHPENNGYIQPFNLNERLRQVQLARSRLLTKAGWLYDSMDNQTATALGDTDDGRVHIYNAEGAELYRGAIDEPTALRNALNNLVGTAPTETDPEQYPAAKIPAKNAGTPVQLDRVHFKPETDRFSPLRIIPAGSTSPFYAKLRAEGDEKLLESGSGKLYLGFHLDPLYSMEWDNKAAPLEYVIWTPSGAAVPSTDIAPEIRTVRSDSEPREFVLTTRQLDLSKALKLRVTYTVYSPLKDERIEIAQNYSIMLDRDPHGGTAYRRQIAHRDPTRKDVARIPVELRHLDTDHDGRLSRSELSGNLWSKFPDIDTNRDGYLGEEEYSTYLMTR